MNEHPLEILLGLAFLALGWFALFCLVAGSDTLLHAICNLLGI